MNADKIESAVLRYGTPLYIFDMDILMEEMGRFRKNLSPETGSFCDRADGGSGRPY